MYKILSVWDREMLKYSFEENVGGVRGQGKQHPQLPVKNEIVLIHGFLHHDGYAGDDPDSNIYRLEVYFQHNDNDTLSYIRVTYRREYWFHGDDDDKYVFHTQKNISKNERNQAVEKYKISEFFTELDGNVYSHG